MTLSLPTSVEGCSMALSSLSHASSNIVFLITCSFIWCWNENYQNKNDSYKNYSEFFCTADFSFLSYLFVYLFVYFVFRSVQTRGYLLYTLSHNPRLLYSFSCSNCSSFGHKELFPLAPGSLCGLPTFVGGFAIIAVVVFEHFLTFWPSKMSQAHFVCFLPSPEISHFSKESGSFHWRKMLETSISLLLRRCCF